MPDSCPHCGASLPAVGDAFCPTCRQALEDIPIVEVVPAQKSRPAPEVKSVAVPALLSSKRWLIVAASIIVVGASFFVSHKREVRDYRRCLDQATTQQARDDCARQFTTNVRNG